MSNIDKIKAGTYKDYLGSAIFGGIVLGLFFSLLNLIENDFMTSIFRGFGTSFSIMIVLFIFGYFHEEWYLRRKRIKLLKTDNYSGIINIGLTLNNELDYVGFIDNYFVRFITFEKWTKKNTKINHSIDIYCNPTDIEKLKILIDKVKDIPDVRNAAWGYGILSTYFNVDTQRHENFIMTIINLLKDYHVKPIAMKTWENSYGKDLRNTNIENEKQQTKQLIKIGKLDIKYKKP